MDGTKKKPYTADVLIANEKIEKIYLKEESEGIEKALEKEVHVMDGSGLVLAPGFIDTHSHSDLQILEKKVLEPKIRQGITTEILGQDGVAMAPLPKAYIEDWRKNIAGLEGDSETLDWTYETVQGYLQAIQANTPTSNSGYLLPHGNVRMAVMGLSNQKATKQQLDQMKQLTKEAMELGCLGLSSGLIYIPCTYADLEEMVELCQVVAAYEGLFVVHQRSEANTILASMDEIIEIGLRSGVKIHFSHFKICGQNNWHLLSQVLGKLEEAKAKGLQVSFDQYPYTAGSTMLGVILPPWVHVGGTNKMLERLKDPTLRAQIKQELLEENCDWDNFIEFAGVGGIFITSVKTEQNEALIGKSLEEIGKIKGKDPLDATLDLLIEENNHVGMIDYYGSEDHVRAFICREEMNACTDGLLGGKPHPRAYGAFPRILGKYVKEEGILSLEEAIHKMTYRPALLFGLKDRGIIREGAYADLILFDEKTFQDKGTYLEPDQFPTGLHLVMVNGSIVFDGALCYEKACGKVLKQERA